MNILSQPALSRSSSIKNELVRDKSAITTTIQTKQTCPATETGLTGPYKICTNDR